MATSGNLAVIIDRFKFICEISLFSFFTDGRVHPDVIEKGIEATWLASAPQWQWQL
jgi:hypothetical protein